MPLPITPPPTAPEDIATQEARMRRALGLDGPLPARPAPAAATSARQRPEQAKTRPRFVRDGEVPVEVVTGPRTTGAAPGGQAAALRADLDAERAARAGAERTLAEAQATIRSLQAKLAHTELAHAEALAAERRAREQAEVALREAVSAREVAERRLNDAAARASVGAPKPRPKTQRATTGKPASRTPAPKGREPKPVKWWLPGFKDTTKAP